MCYLVIKLCLHDLFLCIVKSSFSNLKLELICEIATNHKELLHWKINKLLKISDKTTLTYLILVEPTKVLWQVSSHVSS